MPSRGPEAKNPKGIPEGCGVLGCGRTDGIELVDDGDGRIRALCPRCAKSFLGVSS